MQPEKIINNIEHYPIELLHWAGMNDQCIDYLKTILDKYPHYINTTNLINDNALFVAVRTGNFEIVKYLIENTDINLEHKSVDGNAFSIATLYNQTNIALYLMDKGFSTTELNNNKQTPLFHCAKFGNDYLIEALINNGDNIEHLDNNNQNVFFSFFSNYTSHLNYYCFELLQEKISNDILFRKNKDGYNIIQFMEILIHESKNNAIRQKKLINSFNPILSILQTRL
jgi:ankyrin repeat protein